MEKKINNKVRVTKVVDGWTDRRAIRGDDR